MMTERYNERKYFINSLIRYEKILGIIMIYLD